jgi:hypothetical protein
VTQQVAAAMRAQTRSHSLVVRDIQRRFRQRVRLRPGFHKSLEMLRVYSRDAELFNGSAAAGLL